MDFPSPKLMWLPPVAEHTACQDKVSTLNSWYSFILMEPSSYLAFCGWGRRCCVFTNTQSPSIDLLSLYSASAIFGLIQCLIHLHIIPVTSPPINRSSYCVNDLKLIEFTSLTMCVLFRNSWLCRMVAWPARGSSNRG